MTRSGVVDEAFIELTFPAGFEKLFHPIMSSVVDEYGISRPKTIASTSRPRVKGPVNHIAVRAVREAMVACGSFLERSRIRDV